MTDREELAREEYEADNPVCRAHRQRGCEECEARYLDNDDDTVERVQQLAAAVTPADIDVPFGLVCATCGATILFEDDRWFHERIEDGSHEAAPLTSDRLDQADRDHERQRDADPSYGPVERYSQRERDDLRDAGRGHLIGGA